MKRKELIDKIYSRAIICFDTSVGSQYEEKYQEVGRDYLSLAEEVSRNQISFSSFKEKLERLERHTRTLKRR